MWSFVCVRVCVCADVCVSALIWQACTHHINWSCVHTTGGTLYSNEQHNSRALAAMHVEGTQPCIARQRQKDRHAVGVVVVSMIGLQQATEMSFAKLISVQQAICET